MSNTDSPNEVTNAQPQVIQYILHGKDEMNLAEFPIAKIGRNDKRLIIEYKGQTVDRTGTVHQQKWVVSGSAQFGLPTEFAERILVGLMTLTAQNKFEERKVPFTIYKLLKMLGLTHNTRNYQAVVKALRQLVAVTISSEGAFFDKENKQRVTTIKDFHLIDDFWLRKYERDTEILESEESNGYIVWGERLFKSFEAGYIKNLDVGFYYSLDNTVARRLFRFLDKRMHYQDTYQIDIFDLVGRLGLISSPYPSRLKNKMKPAIEELVARGFLEDFEFLKVGKYHRVKFYKAGKFRNYQTTPAYGADNYSDNQEDDSAIVESRTQASQDEKTQVPYSPLEKRLQPLYEAYSTPDELKNAWAQVLSELETALQGNFPLIVSSGLVAVEGENAVIAIEPHAHDWVERQLSRRIKMHLQIALGYTVGEVSFIPLS